MKESGTLGVRLIIRCAAALMMLTALAFILVTTTQPSSAKATGSADATNSTYTDSTSPEEAGDTPPANSPADGATEDDSASDPGDTAAQEPAGSQTVAADGEKPANTATPSGSHPQAATAPGAQAAAADTTPPQVMNLQPANGSITGPMPVISYNFQDESGVMWPGGVHLFIDHRCSRTMPGITAIDSGSLVYSPAAPLSEGFHGLQAFLMDNVGNFASVNWGITVDASSPVLSQLMPTGSINSSSTVIKAAFSDGTGAGISAGAIHVSLDGGDITGQCAIGGAALECAVSGLVDGTHNVALDVPDTVGNHANMAWGFNVDIASVGISVQLPPPGSWVANAKPEISAQFLEATSGEVDPGSVSVKLDGNDVTATAARTGFNYVPMDALNQGLHTVHASVQDNAGHSGQSDWSFNIDTVPPDISTKTPVGAINGLMPTISASYSDAGSGVNPHSIQLLIDGNDLTAAATSDEYGLSYTSPQNMTSGSHTVQLSLADKTGNQQTVVWSFELAAVNNNTASPASHSGSTGGIIPSSGSNSEETGSTQTVDITSVLVSPGSWVLTGFTALPNSYFFPWYEASNDPRKTEIIIENAASGEASVNLFLASDIKWQGKIAEGGHESVTLPVDSGGPVKIMCPTGQKLNVTMRLSGNGWQNEVTAVSGDDLSPVYMLPWYEAQLDGVDSRLAIANVGKEAAEVDVYIGNQEGSAEGNADGNADNNEDGNADSNTDESDSAKPLKGHYVIEPGTSALVDYPGESGGVLKIECTNGQPLVAGQMYNYRNSVSMTMAASPGYLNKISLLKGDAIDEGGKSWLLVGNPNGKDSDLRVYIGDEILKDPDNPESESITLPSQGARAIPLDPGTGGDIKIVCDSCGFGHGLLAGLRIMKPESINETLATTDFSDNNDAQVGSQSQ